MFGNRMKTASTFPPNILNKKLFIVMLKGNIYMNAKSKSILK